MIKEENIAIKQQIHRDTQHRSTAGAQHGMCPEYNSTMTAL